MTFTSNNAIVTGATGYVGSHLVRRLVNGGWSVHVICRATSNITQLKNLIDHITLHYHNGTTGSMLEIMKKVNPGVVFHLASLNIIQHTAKDIESLVQSNIVFGMQLVETMVETGHFLLINTGTYWQHFEGNPYSPVNLYAATKQAYKSILQFYTETTPLKSITLKLCDTYGPLDPRPKLIPLLLKAAEEQKPIAMSPGEQFIDMVYIDDVVDAFVLAAEYLKAHSSTKFEEYTVSSQHPIKLKELVEVIEHSVQKKINIIWGGRPYRPREMMFPWDVGDLVKGWKPTISLEEGIKRIVLTENDD